jgi:hypothetical protein
MVSLKKLITISITIIILNGCSKSDSTKTGTFSFTKINGKTYTAKYVNTPLPTKNGTFSLQYIKSSETRISWLFWVLIDNNNHLGLDIIGRPVVNGNTYVTSPVFGREVTFYAFLDNQDLSTNGKPSVVFEKSTYPGQIIGTFSVYNPDNTLLGTGKFDFQAE